MKLCGLRTEESVDLAVELGVDAVGFVLTDSIRRVDAERAGALARRVPDGTWSVGVVKGAPIDDVVAAARIAGLDTVQVHDLRSRDDVDRLHAEGLRVIRAVVAGRNADGDSFGEDLLLVDGAVAGAGRTWDWSTYRPEGSWVLAGGLDPSNVRRALTETGASGVDVSSGIESAPGVKDLGLMRSFVTAARSAV